MKVPFARPLFTDADQNEILSGIRSVLASGWLTSGPNVELMEQRFAKFIGTDYAIAVSSCTAALHAILLAMDIKAGDEVLVPTDTFVATANAVLYTGAKPVFVDSDPNSFNMSPEDLESKLSPRTKAILTVHLAGNPCDMKRISEVAEDQQIQILEDCAHAHGAKIEEENCGTFGLAAAFSFYATKIVTSCEGGIVTTDDRKLAERIKRIRNQGRGGYGPQEITELGQNYRMSDVHAVIGLSQLKHLPEFVRERQDIARRYDKFLTSNQWVKPQQVRIGNTCSYYVYLIKLAEDSPLSRDAIAKGLADRGVGTSILYHPAHRQPFYAKIMNQDSLCPVAEELGNRTLALPMYNGMTETEFSYITRQWQEAIAPLEEQYASTS